MQWRQATGADAVADDEEETDLFWRNTTFTWNQAGSTTVFGIGGDTSPDIEVYGWDFTLRPNVYLLDRPMDSVTVFGEIGWVVELTNSDTTADYRETQFKDMAFGAAYNRTLWKSGGADQDEYVTKAGVRLRTVLPTSPASWNSGKYFTLSIGPQISQKIKLLGSKADGLNDLTATLGVTYSHLFSRWSTPTNEDLNRPRRLASGQSALDDQLSGTRFANDQLITSFRLALPLYKDLSLETSLGLTSSFKQPFEKNTIETETGTAEIAQPEGGGTNYQVGTAFDVNLSYPVYEVVSLTLGYNNISPQIGLDGRRRSFLYSYDAQFYLDVTANLDVIYTKVAGRGGTKKASAAGVNGRSRL